MVILDIGTGVRVWEIVLYYQPSSFIYLLLIYGKRNLTVSAELSQQLMLYHGQVDPVISCHRHESKREGKVK